MGIGAWAAGWKRRESLKRITLSKLRLCALVCPPLVCVVAARRVVKVNNARDEAADISRRQTAEENSVFHGCSVSLVNIARQNGWKGETRLGLGCRVRWMTCIDRGRKFYKLWWLRASILALFFCIIFNKNAASYPRSLQFLFLLEESILNWKRVSEIRFLCKIL